MSSTPTTPIADPFDALLTTTGTVRARNQSGADGYGQADPTFAQVGAGFACRYATLTNVPTDKEFESKSKEAIAFRKVYLRPWFVDQSPDGSYKPNHVDNAVTYNTEPLTHDHWLLIENEMYDIFELRNPGGQYHHFEALCRVVEV